MNSYLKVIETELKQKEVGYDTLSDGKSKQDLLNIIQQDRACINAIKEVLDRNARPVVPSAPVSSHKEIPEKTSHNTCAHYNVQEVIQRMTKVSKLQFDLDTFEELRKDKPKAIEYLLSCGIYWQRSENVNIDWMRAVMSVNAISKI